MAVYTLLFLISSFIINTINCNWIKNHSLSQCPQCDAQISNCIDNHECILLANLFQNASENHNNINNNASSMSISDAYFQYYLNWCAINNEYGYNCTNNGFYQYFNCSVLDKNCYNLTENYEVNNKIHIINDINDCEYNELCNDLLMNCWADVDCFDAFFTNFEDLMDVLLNNFRTLSNENLFQIPNFDTANATILKYHCGISLMFDYDNGKGIRCNQIFFDLIECVLKGCIYENADNCIWASCAQELNDCNGFFTSDPAKCNQNLYWLATSYNNLEYIKYVDTNNIDCNSDENIYQCYYYNVVGYCIQNICPAEFWDVVDCIFENSCLDDTDIDDGINIDYSMSGTTLNLFEGDVCLFTERNIYLLDLDGTNACGHDLYQFLYCAFRFTEDDSTIYLKNITSNVYKYYESINTDCMETPYYNGSFYVYADCGNTVKDFTAFEDYSAAGVTEAFLIRIFFVFTDVNSMIARHDFAAVGDSFYQGIFNNYRMFLDGGTSSSSTDYPLSSYYTLGDCNDPTKVPSSAQEAIAPYPTSNPSLSPSLSPSISPSEFPTTIASNTKTSLSPIAAESAEKENNTESNNDLGLIIGVICGVVILIIFVGGIGYWWTWNKKRKNSIENQTSTIN